MKKQQEEKAIFDFFQRLCPDFAGRPVTSAFGNDPPDFLCTDAVGKRIGVELGEWLNQEQIESGIKSETAEKTFIDAIESNKIPHSPKVGFVWIGRKEHARLKPKDAGQFKDEIYSLAKEVDDGWLTNEDVNGPQGYTHYDFSGYPTLAKYLQTLKFFPTNVHNATPGITWIDFPLPGGAYSSKSAIDALIGLFEKKTDKYEDLHTKEMLDELYLVAYFNKGLFYNAPYETLNFGFAEIRNIVREWIKADPGKFQKIFLLDATGEGKVDQIL